MYYNIDIVKFRYFKFMKKIATTSFTKGTKRVDEEKISLGPEDLLQFLKIILINQAPYYQEFLNYHVEGRKAWMGAPSGQATTYKREKNTSRDNPYVETVSESQLGRAGKFSYKLVDIVGSLLIVPLKFNGTLFQSDYNPLPLPFRDGLNLGVEEPKPGGVSSTYPPECDPCSGDQLDESTPGVKIEPGPWKLVSSIPDQSVVFDYRKPAGTPGSLTQDGTNFVKVVFEGKWELDASQKPTREQLEYAAEVGLARPTTRLFCVDELSSQNKPWDHHFRDHAGWIVPMPKLLMNKSHEFVIDLPYFLRIHNMAKNRLLRLQCDCYES